MSVVIYGPVYSTYARTARLVLEEKGIAYELHEIDTLNGAGAADTFVYRSGDGSDTIADSSTCRH